MKLKTILVLLVIILLIVGLFTFQKQTRPVTSKINKVTITVSIYPLWEILRQVGGNYIDLVLIVPPGQEPHEYEVTFQDRLGIQKSQMFVYSGLGIDSWAEKIQHPKTLKMSSYVELIKKEGDINSYDPHYWLDPANMKKATEVIEKNLILIDPIHTDQYKKNSVRYQKELDILDAEFKDKLSHCRFNTIVVAHNAFSYLSKRYGIASYPITGISPEEEPSLKKMKELIDLVKTNNVQYVFFESLTSPKLSETLAREGNVKTLPLNPLEGLIAQELKEGKNYISIMKENLNNLQLSLVCQ